MEKINCIFLIDDNPADNAFHKIKIKAASVCNTVQVATNGSAALAYLKTSADPAQSEKFPRPDLIFLDINLPGMDGFEFLNEYKQLDAKVKSRAVIIMLTTSLNPDDQNRALSYTEVSDFIIKPLTVEKVKSVVDKFFGS